MRIFLDIPVQFVLVGTPELITTLMGKYELNRYSFEFSHISKKIGHDG
jgi:hypothetical protein